MAGYYRTLTGINYTCCDVGQRGRTDMLEVAETATKPVGRRRRFRSIRQAAAPSICPR